MEPSQRGVPGRARFSGLQMSYSVGGNAWNAGSIENVELARTVKVMNALREFPLCNGQLALFGVSRGGEHALLVTSLMVRDGVGGLPDAVAVHAAPDVICGAFDARAYRDAGDPGFQPWDPARRAWQWNGHSDDLLPTTQISIEAYEGPVFLTHGEMDNVWSAQMSHRLEERLKTAGRPVEAHYFADEDHSLRSEAENEFNAYLLDFLRRTLSRESAL